MLGAILVPPTAEAIDSEGIRAASVALEAVCDRVLVFGSGSKAVTHPLPADASDLAAVTAALRQAGEDHVAVLAADLLHPSGELLRYMERVRGSFEAVVPERRNGGLQPLAAIYHGALLRRAEGLIAAGERDLAALLELASVRRISIEETAKFGDPERLLQRGRPAPH